MSGPQREKALHELLLTEIDAVAEHYQGFPLPQGLDENPANWLTAVDPGAYGVPLRPDPAKQPALCGAWMAMFNRPIAFQQFIPPTTRRLKIQMLKLMKRNNIALSDQSDTSAWSARRVSRTRYGTSSNWSGASLQANSGKLFTQIWGSWKVPSPAVPPAGDNQAQYTSAAWIGLDGQRQYPGGSLPQIGTAQDVDAQGKICAGAWVQWWARLPKSASQAVAPVPLKFPVWQGNQISCVLTVLDPNTVLFGIMNESLDPVQFMPILVTAPNLPGDLNGALASVIGYTAEWVMERPTQLNTNTLDGFASYDFMGFTGCLTAGAAPGGIFARDLTVPRFIRMYEPRTAPNRTAYISMPTPVDSSSFNLNYGDFA
jgi:hypothetical protein